MRTQLIRRGSVTFDLVLRTGLASGLSVPALIWAAGEDLRREHERLRFYIELGSRADRSVAFPEPQGPAAVSEQRPPRLTFDPDDGQVRMLRFQSGFEAINPALRASYARHRANGVAWAQHWRHDAGPRPTLAVIHGFGASPYWLNSAFFSLPRLYRLGYDVLLYLLPFHGVRQARGGLSGWGLFAHGPAHFNEAIAHAVHDFRALLSYLQAQGVEQVALTGLSLGGYVASLLASIDDRIDLVIPNAPVVDVARLVREWFPANLLIAGIACASGIEIAELEASMAFHCPLTYDPIVPHAGRMIIGGLGDRLAPPEQARLLWEHWARPRLHWFPGTHILHARRGVYFEEMLTFMRENGFAGGGALVTTEPLGAGRSGGSADASTRAR